MISKSECVIEEGYVYYTEILKTKKVVTTQSKQMSHERET